MATGFSVPALGKGSVTSIASFLRVALEVVWILLWLAVGLSIIGVVAYVGVLIAMQAGALPPETLNAGERITQFGPIKITADTDGELFPIMALPAILALTVALGGALIIVKRLRLLVTSFLAGNSFNRDNANHLRVIWITMLVMELSRYAIWAAITAGVIIFGHPERTELRVDSPVNLMTWGAIGIIIVLAEVFREGARLKEEQELTI